MRNKRGSTIFISIMLGIIFFWFGLAIANPMKVVIDDARSETQLNCSNTELPYQDKANCVMTDMMLPLIVGSIFGLGGFLLGRTFI